LSLPVRMCAYVCVWQSMNLCVGLFFFTKVSFKGLYGSV